MSSYLKSKRAFIPILVIILLILSFIFIDVKWWLPQEAINIINFSIAIIIIIFFEFFAIIFIFFYQKDSIIKLRYHLVIDALIERKYGTLFIHFPLTIIFEELLFRLLIFTYFNNLLEYIPALIINALIFGIYHIHTWFEFNDKKITFSFILVSTNLGLILGACLYYYGILTCILIHYFSVLILFYFIKTRITEVNFY